MKKTIFLSFASLLLCSSCTSTLTKLGNKANDAFTLLKTKASTLFETNMEENRLVVTSAEFYGLSEEDFIPLDESDGTMAIVSKAIPQAAQTPGTAGSNIPSIQQFKNPDSILANLFKKIYFNTDQYTPNANTPKLHMQKLATYLRKHPSTHIFIEGHCDERASESYNLALGTKRAGTIRTILVNYGASPNQLHTISYGKEKPAAKGKSKAIFAKNRRVEFKIYNGNKK